MKSLSLLLNRTDQKLGKLGFKKIRESEYGASYERYNKEYKYTQVLDILQKASGNHLVMSYQEDVNKDGFNNEVGLTYQEMKLIMKKYKELEKRYWR